MGVLGAGGGGIRLEIGGCLVVRIGSVLFWPVGDSGTTMFKSSSGCIIG